MISILTTILLLISLYPISLPFLSNFVRNQLDNHFHTYYVDFDTLRTRWHPFEGKIEFHLDSAKAVDYGNNNIATVPEVIIVVDTDTIFRKHKKLQSVELHNPKISLIRSHGGAFKFDIGNTHDGSSGRILETILIHVATTPKIHHQNTHESTNIKIISSDLTLGDEITGSLLHAPNANIELSPDVNGVNCNYKFNVFARGEYINILGDCLYNTRSKSFSLSIQPDKVRPALLTEFFPQFSYLTPLEVHLSGNIQLEFDDLLNAKMATFDITSDNGTLEVSEVLGNNLEINSLHVIGRALNEFSHIELDQLSIDLKENNIQAEALILIDKSILDINLNAFIKGNSILDLLPHWFEYINSEELYCIENNDELFRHTSISFNGTYDLNQENINALGHVKCHEVLLSSNTQKYSLEDYLNSTIKSDLNFRIDGALNAPNLVTAQ
ncbi:MAG: hypothetical protein R8G33_02705 [Gammaproteobacteria bacterium]|nr:hypothetical protein [Gammaproteobacteria bacterium]